MIQVGEEEFRAPFTPKSWIFNIPFVYQYTSVPRSYWGAECCGKRLTVNLVHVFLIRNGSLFLY